MAATATGSAGVAASFSLSDFDAENPQAFYLWEQGEEMEAMADACLIVEGTRLPVHTQVLSLACGVLRRMFADLRSPVAGGTEGDASGPSRKRKADEMEQELTIEAPLAGFSVSDVALFLRLLYDSRWQTAAAATFDQLADHLPALLRLAHQLEARQLLGALCDYMAGCTKRAQLISSLIAAEECQLDELRNSCLLRLGQDLAECSSDLASALAHAALLERCGARTLAQLLGIVASAGHRSALLPSMLRDAVPSAADLGQALQAAANPGRFEWTVEAFSEKPSALGSYLDSPLFKAAGQTWKLRLYPGACAKPSRKRFLAVYLTCMQRNSNQVCGRFTAELLDGDGIVRKSRTSSVYRYGYGDKRGWDNFLIRRHATQHNLLAGDRLRLRVTVTLVA